MNATAPVIPARSAIFRDFVVDLIQDLLKVAAKDPTLIEGALSPCLYVEAPWIMEPKEPAQKAEFAERLNRLKAASFDGPSHLARAENILATDAHLGKCCVQPFDLFRLVDKLALQFLAVPIRLDHHNELGKAWGNFENLIYANGEFKKIALCHLFNFDCSEPVIEFDEFKIARVPPLALARAVGDTNNSPFTYHQGVGDFYIVIEDPKPCENYIDWLYEKHAVAAAFSQLLPYFKDGVVHLDYSAIYFTPDWVNDIRKGGVFFVGSPRRFAYHDGVKPYRINSKDIAQLRQWWRIYTDTKIATRMSSANNFRAALNRAGQYFESSMEREVPADRLIDLAISVESMFTTGSGDLTFKISQAAAQFVGSNSNDRRLIQCEIKNLYDRRSDLFHGRNLDVTHDQVDKWSAILRKAYLGLLVLYLRGEKDRDRIVKSILESGLDSDAAEEIRRRSDIDVFASEFEASAG